MTTVAFLDTETTGLLTPDHRIIEVYAELVELETKTRLDEFCQRIDPQRSIAAEAQRVHGISLLDLAGCPAWLDVALSLRAFLGRADFLVAHNGMDFDVPFLDQEFARVGVPKLTAPCIDTMLQGRWATANGKVPNLGELCFACDVPYDPALAHKADYDVATMREAFFRAHSWGWFKLEIKEAA